MSKIIKQCRFFLLQVWTTWEDIGLRFSNSFVLYLAKFSFWTNSDKRQLILFFTELKFLNPLNYWNLLFFNYPTHVDSVFCWLNQIWLNFLMKNHSNMLLIPICRHFPWSVEPLVSVQFCWSLWYFSYDCCCSFALLLVLPFSLLMKMIIDVCFLSLNGRKLNCLG